LRLSLPAFWNPVSRVDEIPPTLSQVIPEAERFELVMGGVAVQEKKQAWENGAQPLTRGCAMMGG
jgi:hypothetical protein